MAMKIKKSLCIFSILCLIINLFSIGIGAVDVNLNKSTIEMETLTMIQ